VESGAGPEHATSAPTDTSASTELRAVLSAMNAPRAVT
jgi:hypothetical protein